jgi:ACR3 family arsenite transporter
VPILIQVYFNTGLAYWLSRRFGVFWFVATPALIGASNFFELVVVAAIRLFGLNSGATLARPDDDGSAWGALGRNFLRAI